MTMNPGGASGWVLRLRRGLIVGLHVVLIPLAYGLAFALRFNGPVPPRYVELAWATIPALLVIRLACFAVFRLFNGWWRHVGMYDLQALVKATTLSSVLFALYLLAVGDLPGVPRSVLVIDWIVALTLFGGIRFAVRWSRERGLGRSWEIGGRRTLIIGAGDTGAHLLHQLRQHPENGLQPVGLVDDDPHKAHLQLHGVPVVGTTRDLERVVARMSVSLIVLAIPTATSAERRRIAERCSGLSVEIKVVPALEDLLGGRASLTELREFDMEDLLGRAPVTLDLARVKEDLEGRVVLVTGGAGSIGSELARQIAAFRPALLILLDQAESPLYFVDYELRATHPELNLLVVVGNVTDTEALEGLFARHRPDYVFHAAAYKHVPMMEDHVAEAVHNNVLGTRTVAVCAARYGAGKFVLISTDKAVRPSSVMGATKRIAERIVLGLPQLRASPTDFRAVRFGNVLGSAGSVVPLFRRQISAGGPVTVTHPEITRYFMTIPEAVQLVLQAAALPEAAGRIAMLEMGEPVRILDMAENLIRLSGLTPYDDMPITFVGLRPGEKLHEELMSTVEHTVPTRIRRVRVVQTPAETNGAVAEGVTRLAAATAARNVNEAMACIAELVPEAVAPLSGRYREAAARRALRPARLDEPTASNGRPRRGGAPAWTVGRRRAADGPEATHVAMGRGAVERPQ